MDLGAVIAQTEQLIQLLFDISAERQVTSLSKKKKVVINFLSLLPRLFSVAGWSF